MNSDDPTAPNPVRITIELPSDEHSNEIQLMAALEKVTDVLIDDTTICADGVRARVARWYAERYGR